MIDERRPLDLLIRFVEDCVCACGGFSARLWPPATRVISRPSVFGWFCVIDLAFQLDGDMWRGGGGG